VAGRVVEIFHHLLRFQHPYFCCRHVFDFLLIFVAVGLLNQYRFLTLQIYQ